MKLKILNNRLGQTLGLEDGRLLLIKTSDHAVVTEWKAGEVIEILSADEPDVVKVLNPSRDHCVLAMFS